MSAFAAIATGVACGSGNAEAPAPVPPVESHAAPAVSDASDATCNGKLGRVNAPPELPPSRKERRVALASLVADAPKLRIVKSKSPLDLGDLQVRDRNRPHTGVDLARIAVKREPLRVALPAPAISHWDALFDATDRRHEALRRVVAARDASGACRDCLEQACLSNAAAGAQQIADQAKISTKTETDALLALLAPLAKETNATPSVLVAEGWLLESRARTVDSDGDLAPMLKEPIALYSRAMALAPASDPIGLWARYLRAGALEDAGLALDAREAWREISAVDSKMRAEAFFRVGSLDDDATRALAAYASARDADVSPEKTVQFASLIRALGVADDADKSRDALDIALRLGAFPSADVDDEAARAIARAIDHLAGQLPAGVEAPVTMFAKTALLAADFADDRGDRERAEKMRRAVLANASGTHEADDATKALENPRLVPPDPNALKARLVALASSCRVNDFGGTIDLVATAANVTITAKNPGDRAFVTCMTDRKTWYLGATQSWPEFRARIVN